MKPQIDREDSHATPSINFLAHRAIEYLTSRYYEQCALYPTMSMSISLKGYIDANLKYAIRNIRNRYSLGQSDKPTHHATVLP